MWFIEFYYLLFYFILFTFNSGTIWEIKTPNKINKHPTILFILSTWLSNIHAAIVAITPSKEKIIAAGVGVIFFWAYICNTNAKPPDNIPA